MPKSSSTLGILSVQAWRLQAFLTLLVAILATAPPAIFTLIELSRAHENAERQAHHIVSVIRILVEKKGVRFEDLDSILRHEIEPAGLVSVQLMDQNGREISRVVNSPPFLFAIEIPVPVEPPIGSLHDFRFMVDDRRFLSRVARVSGIHFTVAVILGFAIYKMGILSLRRALDELAGMQEQLIRSEKLKAIGEMYAGLTHEINNPLGIILSRIELLQDAAKQNSFPPDSVRNLDIIYRHGNRIAETVKGLLAFARTSLEMTDTDLNHVINETVALVEKPFSESKIQIARHLSGDLPRISGNSIHLQQVLINLLNNARDAMPQGGNINLRTYRNGHYVIAEVEDSGTGIAEEIRDRIFEPFFTTKEVGRGTGLGLSVSYGIMKAHGGDVEVENAHPKGAVFRLLLPMEGGEI